MGKRMKRTPLSLLDEMDGLLANETEVSAEASFTATVNIPFFSGRAAQRVQEKAIVSPAHSHVAPPIL